MLGRVSINVPTQRFWQRWTVLAMLAYAFLAVLTATERDQQPSPKERIPLICNEIHHLFDHLITQPITDLWHRLHRPTWPRQHQHRAKISHYRSRE